MISKANLIHKYLLIVLQVQYRYQNPKIHVFFFYSLLLKMIIWYKEKSSQVGMFRFRFFFSQKKKINSARQRKSEGFYQMQGTVSQYQERCSGDTAAKASLHCSVVVHQAQRKFLLSQQEVFVVIRERAWLLKKSVETRIIMKYWATAPLLGGHPQKSKSYSGCICSLVQRLSLELYYQVLHHKAYFYDP